MSGLFSERISVEQVEESNELAPKFDVNVMQGPFRVDVPAGLQFKGSLDDLIGIICLRMKLLMLSNISCELYRIWCWPPYVRNVRTCLALAPYR